MKRQPKPKIAKPQGPIEQFSAIFNASTKLPAGAIHIPLATVSSAKYDWGPRRPAGDRLELVPADRSWSMAMDILNASVAQHHEVILKAVQSETFKKIVAAGASGLELSSKSKLVTREPDVLHNLLVLQLVEHASPLAGGDIDDEPWDLLSVSPEGVERHDLDRDRLYRRSALGAAVQRVMDSTLQEEPELESVRESLQHLLVAEWLLHCKLAKNQWRYDHPHFLMLRRLETLWSEFVECVAQDVAALATLRASEMTERTKDEMISLLERLRVVQTARLENPHDSAIDALSQIKDLVDQWPLRVAMAQLPPASAEEPEVRQHVKWKGDPELWIANLFEEMGPLPRTRIEQVRNARGGPSWGTIQGTKFWKDYMAHRKERGDYVPRGGKQVTLDAAESELARMPSERSGPEPVDDDDRADEADINEYRASQIKRLDRESKAQTAKDDALYRNARRNSDRH